MNGLAHPLHFLDFEASGLHGVPIEIGIATLALDGKIDVWSTLIRPTREWLDDEFLWDPAAEQIHAIPRQTLLDEGQDVRMVMSLLRSRVGSAAILISDSPQYEAAWMGHLLEASDYREKTRYSIVHYYEVVRHHLGKLSDEFHEADQEVNIAKPHRAGPDAEILARHVRDFLFEGAAF